MSMHPLSWEEMAAQMKRNHREALAAAKFIFMDFDGVLNTEGWQRRCRENGEPASDDFGPVFDPEAVRSLTTILKAVPEARIVITSTWKWEGLGLMKGMWLRRRLPGHVIGMTPDLPHEDLLQFNLADPDFMVRVEGHCKGNEILAWLKSHADEECRYVILDDCKEFSGELKEHLVLVDPIEGLTRENALMAIMRLSQKDHLERK